MGSFELSLKDGKARFVLSADSLVAKQDWVRDIKRIVKEYQKAEYEANKYRLVREADERERKRVAFKALSQKSAEPTPEQNSDVWMLGLVLWHMYTQQPLFPGLSPAQAAIAMMTRTFQPEIPKDMPAEVAELIQDCWLEKEDARPTFAMVYDQIRMLDLEFPTQAMNVQYY